MKFTTVLLIMVFVFAPGCRHETDFTDLPEISFKNDIQPIIGANCASSGCHGEINHQEIQLLTYEDVRSIVTPGNAHNSKLYNAITGKEEDPMPPSGPLGDQQVQLIYIWIMQGAKNN